jgi:hypothetical protein
MAAWKKGRSETTRGATEGFGLASRLLLPSFSHEREKRLSRHFLRNVSMAQGIFGTTGPVPSANLIFTVCMSELTPTTSKTPSC